MLKFIDNILTIKTYLQSLLNHFKKLFRHWTLFTIPFSEKTLSFDQKKNSFH